MKKALALLVAVALVAMAVTAFAGVITLTNSTVGTFDANSGTRVVTVTGLEPGYGTGTITDVNITIDFVKRDEGSMASTPFFERSWMSSPEILDLPRTATGLSSKSSRFSAVSITAHPAVAA